MKRTERDAVLFLAPALALLFAFGIYPLLYGVYLSFTGYYIPEQQTMYQFVGLNNYLNAFRDPVFAVAFTNTLLYCAVIIFPNIAIGLGIALLLNRGFKGKMIFSVIFTLPLSLSPIVAGFIWRFMLQNPWGIVNYFLGLVHIPEVFWFSSYQMAFLSVSLVGMWQLTPFVILLFLAALQSMPKPPLEAAKIDGAGRWATFRYVTLPLLRPIILVVVLLRIIAVFRIYEVIFALTSGGPGISTNSLATYLYTVGFQYQDAGQASAYGLENVLVEMPFIVLFIWLMLKRRNQ